MGMFTNAQVQKMIPRLGDGNSEYIIAMKHTSVGVSLENDSPSRGRKLNIGHLVDYQEYVQKMIPRLGDGNRQRDRRVLCHLCLENDSPSRGRKRKKCWIRRRMETSLENDSPSRGRKRIPAHDGRSSRARLENDSPSRGRKLTGAGIYYQMKQVQKMIPRLGDGNSNTTISSDIIFVQKMIPRLGDGNQEEMKKILAFSDRGFRK